MGTDIHDYLEIRRNGTWTYAGDNAFPNNEYGFEHHSPFDGVRSYDLYGFLANVRRPTTASLPARGLPADISPEVAANLSVDYFHSASWATLAELQAVNYQQNVPARHDPDEALETLGEILGDWYFDRLKLIATHGNPEDLRIVFAFDN